MSSLLTHSNLVVFCWILKQSWEFMCKYRGWEGVTVGSTSLHSFITWPSYWKTIIQIIYLSSYKFVPSNDPPFRQIMRRTLKKFILDEEHNNRRYRKTAPGPKNSLSLLKMSVQLGAAFTILKQYKNITSIACLRYDKNIWTFSFQSTNQYHLANVKTSDGLNTELVMFFSWVDL